MTAYAERVRLEILDLADGMAAPAYSRQVAALLAGGSTEELASLYAGDLAPLERWLDKRAPVTWSPSGLPRRWARPRDLSCTAELVAVLNQVKPRIRPGARTGLPDDTPLADLRVYADDFAQPGERLIHSLAAVRPARWARRMRRALRRKVMCPDRVPIVVWTLPWATATQLARLTPGDLLPLLEDEDLHELARRALPHVGKPRVPGAP